MIYYYIFFILSAYSFVSDCSENPTIPKLICNRHVTMYPGVKENLRLTEKLYVASTTPFDVSFGNGSAAKPDQKNNLPNPQHWIKSTEKTYVYRYAFDPNINVSYTFKYPKNNSQPLFLFDGPNQNNTVVHVCVDDINEKSTMYLLSGANANDAKDTVLTLENTQNTLLQQAISIKQSIKQIALSHDGTALLMYSIQGSQHWLELRNINNRSFTSAASLKSLKKIFCFNSTSYAYLTNDGELHHCLTDNHNTKTLNLTLQDVAFDPESQKFAGLTKDGTVYTFALDNFNAVTHIHTWDDKVQLALIDRMSYRQGKITFLLNSADERDALAYGSMIQLNETKIQNPLAATNWQSKRFIYASALLSVTALIAALYYCNIINKIGIENLKSVLYL